MNPKADNIEKVIASIEAEPERFDMRRWNGYEGCRTTHCIGGWINHHVDSSVVLENDEAGEWIGIDPVSARELFFAYRSSAPLSDITKDMAIAALRDLQKDPVFKGWDHYAREDA